MPDHYERVAQLIRTAAALWDSDLADDTAYALREALREIEGAYTSPTHDPEDRKVKDA